MSVIQLPVLFVGSKGERNLFTMFDSGANLSCIHPDFVKNLEKPVSIGRPRQVGTTAEGHFIKITQRVTLDFYLNDVLLSDEFLVVENLPEQAIFGATTLRKWRIKMDFENNALLVNANVAKFKLIDLRLQ